MALDLFNYADPAADVVIDEGRILADLSEREWTDFLNLVERQSHPAGAEVLRAGDRDRTLYLIASGSVDVVLDGPKGRRRLSTISEGSVFGEMAFFDGEPRSATIVARDDLQLLALRKEAFEQFSAWHPRIAQKLLMDLGRVLSQRLRRLTLAF